MDAKTKEAQQAEHELRKQNALIPLKTAWDSMQEVMDILSELVNAERWEDGVYNRGYRDNMKTALTAMRELQKQLTA